jgi:hypothetical protein
MKITFTQDKKGKEIVHQARVEQTFSTGDGHGDFCLTAYGDTQWEAQANLQELAMRMARELDTVRSP